MITIKDPGPKLSELDISNLEKRIGMVLPEAYRRFLLEHNGGRLTPDNDTMDIDGFSQSPTDVRTLLGVNRISESSRIEWNLEILSECRLPQWILPIASDSGGGVFCLSLREHDYGAVSYCDLQSVYGRFDVKPEFYPVAPDFDSFLKKIRPCEPAT